MDPEKFVSLKNCGPEKKLGSEKIWVPKMLRAQKNLGPETFGNKKIGPHKIWVLKILVPKNFGPEKIWVQNKFRPQKF